MSTAGAVADDPLTFVDDSRQSVDPFPKEISDTATLVDDSGNFTHVELDSLIEECREDSPANKSSLRSATDFQIAPLTSTLEECSNPGLQASIGRNDYREFPVRQQGEAVLRRTVLLR